MHVAQVVTRTLWTYAAVMEMQGGQERAGGTAGLPGDAVNPWFCTVHQQNLAGRTALEEKPLLGWTTEVCLGSRLRFLRLTEASELLTDGFP